MTALAAQKTKGHLLVSYPGQPTYRLDLLKEFAYRYDVMAVGDVCEFSLVNERDGSTLQKLRLGSTVKLYLSNPRVNGGQDTLKHYGRIVNRQAAAAGGVVKVQAPDLGWHLMTCDAPLYTRTRGLTLDELVDPLRYRRTKKGIVPPFIDETFGLEGLRTGLDANQLNRNLKQGRAGTLAFANKVLTPVNVIQVEAGETFFDVVARYLQRFNLLLNVSCDGYLQVWNPDYSRPPAYQFYKTEAKSNIIDAKVQDDASTRYTEVTCVGEIVNKFLSNPSDPNATKVRGYYRAAKRDDGLPAPVPYRHRLTKSDGEMFNGTMAAKQAEWLWKRGMFDSHYLEIDVVDHFQGGRWLEADELAEVDIPELDVRGIYYVQAVHCISTVEGGDVTKLILRWPHLLSASWGEWPNPPIYRSGEAQDAAGKKGTGGSSGG